MSRLKVFFFWRDFRKENSHVRRCRGLMARPLKQTAYDCISYTNFPCYFLAIAAPNVTVCPPSPPATPLTVAFKETLFFSDRKCLMERR